MIRIPTDDEIEAIKNTLRRGDRVEAIRQYLSASQGNLTDAQKAIGALRVDIQTPAPLPPARKGWFSQASRSSES